ncbi:hypothetical protein HMPREF3034_02254 [Prevotella sp. DNF00663]|uniref:grasp-with-spasm system ATP-grasp peptide maturase n=1 Tax=Prevotella sp. DNF00663 TaxID=1384078 RepID=UPI0007859CFD|nr:grasp-with-spasm system ATP-grasp peptide maturase [Prevotella sp. DNF00663]KXB78938.1 hypothetical protein HMPREF3034_02254 [Prevotella sp. DNF00663]
MILILGRTDDASTHEVGKWLKYLGKEYIVIHGNVNDNNVKFISCDLNHNQIIVSINSQYINLADVTSVWNRRDGFSKVGLGIDFSIKHKLLPTENNNVYIKSVVNEEAKFLINYIHSFFALSEIKQLGLSESNVVNKLEVLSIAQKIGLLIPDTYVLTQKKDLQNLLNTNKNDFYITKPISQGGVYYFSEKANYYSYVERIQPSFFNRIPEQFYPSLFQKEIKKKYELRCFILNEEVYSMAILSQKINETVTDYRKPICSHKKMRMVPYTLPQDIENKLFLLFKKLDLNTGSVDIIVDENNSYYFLEINPVGQFAMTSYPCNYYLERKIANIL